MNLALQKGKEVDDIDWKQWQVCFHGDVLDDRGEAAVQQLKNKTSEQILIRYNSDSFNLEIGSTVVSSESLREHLSELITGSVVLEATTLGFVEILLCCRALFELQIRAFDIIYLEPEDYRRPNKRHLLRQRDFELSGMVPGYRGIPGHAILFNDRSPHKGIFFLGYEESRLRRAFEDMQMIKPGKSAVAFGVPAFEPGWEMDALANNIDVIRDQRISGGVFYCGAENPLAVIEVLTEFKAGLQPGERLFVAPIGTKPHGIGVALFVAENRDVRIIYDHPTRVPKRSSKISHWHRFSVTE